MKKFIIVVGLLFTMPHTAVADQQDIPLEYNQKSNPNKNGTVNRAPMHLPIDVFYDSDTHTIIVIGSDSLNAEVYVHDSTGTRVFHSASLNTNYTFSTPGTYTIQIQGDGWYAEGEIEV